MEIALYLVRSVATALLNVLYWALFLRMIFSLFDPEMEKRISVFLFVITEPMIQPVRKLCQRMNWFQGSPIDFSFMITSLLVFLLMLVVEAV